MIVTLFTVSVLTALTADHMAEAQVTLSEGCAHSRSLGDYSMKLLVNSPKACWSLLEKVGFPPTELMTVPRSLVNQEAPMTLMVSGDGNLL